MVGRVWPRHGHRGRPLNSVVRPHRIEMPALSSYPNVWNTALVVLRDKGFRVWTDADQTAWFAERGGWDLLADDPIQLLGLVAIFEHRMPRQFREYWWQLDEPDLLSEVPQVAPEFQPVWKR